MKLHVVVTNTGECNVVKRMKPVLKDLINNVNFSYQGMCSSKEAVISGFGVFESKVVGFDQFVARKYDQNQPSTSVDDTCKISDDSVRKRVRLQSSFDIYDEEDDASTDSGPNNSPNAKAHASNATRTLESSTDSLGSKIVGRLFKQRTNKFNVRVEQKIECENSVLDQLPVATPPPDGLKNLGGVQLLFPITKKIMMHVFWFVFKNHQFYIEVVKPKLVAWRSYLSLNNMENWIIAVIVPRKQNEKISIFKPKNKYPCHVVREDFEETHETNNLKNVGACKRVIYINDNQFETLVNNHKNFEHFTKSFVHQCVESFHDMVVKETSNLDKSWNVCRCLIGSVVKATGCLKPHVSAELPSTNASTRSSWKIQFLFRDIALLTGIYYNSELYQNALDLTVKNCSRLRKYLSRFIFDGKKYTHSLKTARSAHFRSESEGCGGYMNSSSYMLKNERFSVANISMYGNVRDMLDELVITPSATNDNDVCSTTDCPSTTTGGHTKNSASNEVFTTKLNSNENPTRNSRLTSEASLDGAAAASVSGGFHNLTSQMKRNSAATAAVGRNRFRNFATRNRHKNTECLEILGLVPENISLNGIDQINETTLGEIHDLVACCFNKSDAIENLLLPPSDTERCSTTPSPQHCIIRSLLSFHTIGLQLFLSMGCIDFAIYFACDVIHTCEYVLGFLLCDSNDCVLADRIEGIFMLECFIRLLARVSNVIDQFNDATIRETYYIDNWKEIFPSKKALSYSLAHLMSLIDSCVDRIHVSIASYSYHPLSNRAIKTSATSYSQMVNSLAAQSKSDGDHFERQLTSSSLALGKPTSRRNATSKHKNSNNSSRILDSLMGNKTQMLSRSSDVVVGNITDKNSPKLKMGSEGSSDSNKNLMFSRHFSYSALSNNFLSSFKNIGYRTKPSKGDLSPSAAAAAASKQIPSFEISIVKAKSLLKPQFFDTTIKSDGISAGEPKLSGDLAFSFVNQAHKIYNDFGYPRHIHTSERHLLLRFIRQSNYESALRIARALEATFLAKNWLILYVDVVLYELQICFRLLESSLSTLESTPDTDHCFYSGQCHRLTVGNRFTIEPYLNLLAHIESSVSLIGCCKRLEHNINVRDILIKLAIYGENCLTAKEFKYVSRFVELFSGDDDSRRQMGDGDFSHLSPLFLPHNYNGGIFLSGVTRWDSGAPSIASTTSHNLCFYNHECIELVFNLNIAMFDANKIKHVWGLFVAKDVSNSQSRSSLDHGGSASNSCSTVETSASASQSSAIRRDSISNTASHILPLASNQTSDPHSSDFHPQSNLLSRGIVFKSKISSFDSNTPNLYHNGRVLMEVDRGLAINSSVECGQYVLKEFGFMVGDFYVYSIVGDDCWFDEEPPTLCILPSNCAKLEARPTNLYMIPKYQSVDLFVYPLLPSFVEAVTTLKLESVDKRLCVSLQHNHPPLDDTSHSYQVECCFGALEKDHNLNRYNLSVDVCPAYVNNNDLSKSIFCVDSQQNEHALSMMASFVTPNDHQLAAETTRSQLVELNFIDIVTAALATFPMNENDVYVHIVCFNVGNVFDLFINDSRLEIVFSSNPSLIDKVDCVAVTTESSRRGFVQKSCNYAFLWKITFHDGWKNVDSDSFSIVHHYNISMDDPYETTDCGVRSFSFSNKFDKVIF